MKVATSQMREDPLLRKIGTHPCSILSWGFSNKVYALKGGWEEWLMVSYTTEKK